MATEHDSMLFQPEEEDGWSCGPITIVKVLETLLQLERNGKTKFLGKRAHLRLETESWQALKRRWQQRIEKTISYPLHLTHQPSQHTFILEQFGLK